MAASSIFVARINVQVRRDPTRNVHQKLFDSSCCVKQMLLFWHRRISWTEVTAEAGVIIPLSLASLAIGTVRCRHRPCGWREITGATIFSLGTLLNFWSEYDRYAWKLDPAHAGHLYTEGLWQWSRHINYFGEIASFVGPGLWCGDGCFNLWIPMAMGVGMAGWSVPELDFYLSRRYPDEWSAYTATVPWSMVPMVW